jgi:two-component system repressor protein LuxO
MESEIFGHVKGAFTGAVRAREGAAAQANGGTLFLDEVCEMDIELQSKLLRFIQTGTYQAIGDSKQTNVDVRFVCATNRDPLEEVKKGRFREDLYYRLHVIPIALPPLREREDDVLLIAGQFLEGYSGEEGKSFKRYGADAESVIRNYPWPGNVRELQNVIRQIVVLNPASDVVSAAMLPAPLGGPVPRREPGDEPSPDPALRAEPQVALTDDGRIQPLWQVERDAIESAIAHCDGNIPKAAALLGISASTVYRKRQNWETST